MKDQLNIVVAENDSERRASISRVLGVHRGRGWTINTAKNETQLFEMAERKGVSAIVLESLFPMSSMSAIIKLRSNIKTASVPILAVTGSVGPQSKELLSAGASHCIGPPAGARKITAGIREMIANPIPVTHAPSSVIGDLDRMTKLIATNLLGAAPKKQFDMVSKLVMSILGVPVALISLVDEDRQYFLSQHGLVEPWASLRETPLSHSFCQWVVASKEPLVVGDAREDPVLVNNLAIRDLGVVAYAGQPITAGGTKVIGSLCAIDSHPRSWTYDELATLRDLANLTECYIAFEEQGFDPEDGDSSEPGNDDPDNLNIIHLQAIGIEAISRLLQRAGLTITAKQRRMLLAVVQVFSHSQSRLSHSENIYEDTSENTSEKTAETKA